MIVYETLEDESLVNELVSGAVGFLPTDTIYGLSCSAFAKESVARIYEIKGRAENKPVIVLLADISELDKFHVVLDERVKSILNANWPGGISFILPIAVDFDYLARGSAGLAFRLPAESRVRSLLAKTGPLLSTSANPSGLAPAMNMAEATSYFADSLDLYVDLGDLHNEASTIVDLTGGAEKILRQGAHELLL